MPQLLSNLPNRALIKFGSHSVASEAAQPIIWMVADKNHNGYPTNSVTLITERIIDQRAYDAREPNQASGIADYKLSNIHQWLNSDASAGNWYKASHANDVAPTNEATYCGTGYSSRPGFLYNFSDSEKQALLPTTLTLGTGETITARVFLPSVKEIMGSGGNSGDSRFSCFLTGTTTAKLTQQVFTYGLSTSKPASIDNAWDYNTRLPFSISTDRVETISEISGSTGQSVPSYGDTGVRPVINLVANTKVTDTTDSSGCYTILPQSPPEIIGLTDNQTNKSEGFSLNYTVNETDGDSLTVTEYIDNVKIRSYVANSGTSNIFSIEGATWFKLASGAHTLKVVATDGFDTVTREYNFIREVSPIKVQFATPKASDTMPTRLLVTLVRVIPEGANLLVEACNNGFDASPVWETVDVSNGTSGFKHVFTNAKKETTNKWGVNIRVTVNRNGASGACYITEIGGNFE